MDTVRSRRNRFIFALTTMTTIRVGKSLQGRIVEIMSEWLDSTTFGRRYVNGPLKEKRGPDSIREFISWVYALHMSGRITIGAGGTSTFPGFDATLNELLILRSRMNGGPTESLPLVHLMVDGMMEAWAPDLLSEASTYQTFYPETKRRVDDMVAECGAKDFQDLYSALDGSFGTDLRRRMLEVTLRTVGDRALRSFFIKDRSRFGRWWPGATTSHGRPLPDHSIPTEFGPVVVRVSRYDDDGEGMPVRAYEWHGTLGGDHESPEAVCVGMAYVFERSWGSPDGDIDDLVYASDLVADNDVLQVKAFITQHEDCEEIIEDSDLGFVWIWERNPQGRKGTGTACLQACVRDLRKRFRSLRTVVIEATPYQFLPLTDVVEPAPIQEARLEALDKLQAHIAQLDFGRHVEVLTVVDRDAGDIEAAQSFVGAVGLVAFLARGGDPSTLMSMEDLVAAFRGAPPADNSSPE